MKKTIQLSFTAAVSLATLFAATAVFAQVVPQVQTEAATNVVNNQATLNGYLSSLNGYGTANVWFQYGTTSSYGSQTPQISQSTLSNFSQIVTGLQANTTYYFEAVAQTSGGTAYGQQLTFYTGNNGNNNGSLSVQTEAATSVSTYQAMLNGYLSGTSNLNSTNYLWFQYGTTTSYGSTTGQQTLINPGSFSQTVTGLTPNTLYHFEAVVQNGGIIQYGQDMTFYTSTNGNNNGSCYYVNGVYTCGSNNNNNCYYVNNVYTCGGTNGTFNVTEQVINLTSGNLNWQNSVNANPGDLLSFAVTIQPNGSEIDNVNVRDLLPAGLVYRGNVTLNTSNYGGDITQGINIGSVYANQPVVVAFQAQASSVNYGTIANPVTVTSSDAGTQTATASVYMTNPAPSVLGAATYVDTGLTNNILSDSFFLPLLLILAGLYLYFSGNAVKFADWIKAKV